MKTLPSLSFPKNEPALETSDYVIFLNSSDFPKDGRSSGPSACVWQIRTMEGEIVDYPDAKPSRTEISDEKRGLVAALVGALERVGIGSFCLIYAPGTYICDGIAYARDWKARGCRNSQNEAVANPELWNRYLELLDERQLDVSARVWTKCICTNLRSDLNRKARDACNGRN